MAHGPWLLTIVFYSRSVHDYKDKSIDTNSPDRNILIRSLPSLLDIFLNICKQLRRLLHGLTHINLCHTRNKRYDTYRKMAALRVLIVGYEIASLLRPTLRRGKQFVCKQRIAARLLNVWNFSSTPVSELIILLAHSSHDLKQSYGGLQHCFSRSLVARRMGRSATPGLESKCFVGVCSSQVRTHSSIRATFAGAVSIDPRYCYTGV